MDKVEELYKRRKAVEEDDTAGLLTDFTQYLDSYKLSLDKGSKEATEADLIYAVFKKIATSTSKDETTIRGILRNCSHGFRNKPHGVNKKCILWIVSFLHSRDISYIEKQAAGISNE